MGFNQEYINDQVRLHLEAFNEDVENKKKWISCLQDAERALGVLHGKFHDAQFQNDMALISEKIFYEKQSKLLELEEFSKSFKVTIEVDKLSDEVNSDNKNMLREYLLLTPEEQKAEDLKNLSPVAYAKKYPSEYRTT